MILYINTFCLCDCRLLTGWYVYFETSAPVSVNDNAILTIHDRCGGGWLTYDPTRNCLFTFAYHMFGATTGRLNIYVEPKGGSATMAWTKISGQGDKWIVDSVDVRSYLSGSTQFRVSIEAVYGSGFTGDIALDDLMFGTCT